MAIDTSAQDQTFIVHSRTVPCDGGDGPLGHPRVWLRITGDSTLCPYCSRKYVLEAVRPGGDDVHS